MIMHVIVMRLLKGGLLFVDIYVDADNVNLWDLQ